MVKVIARRLALPQSAVRIVRGAAARRKAVSCEGLERRQILERLRRPVRRKKG